MSIDREEFKQTLFDTLAKLAEIEVSEINPDDRLREDLGLDSLKSMELLSRISERYEIDPDMDDVMAVSTVDDIMTYLLKYLE